MYRYFPDATLDQCALRDRSPAHHPVENLWQRIPEVIEWREHGELVGQHVGPHSFESGAMWHKHLKRGDGNRLVGTFLSKYIKQHGSARSAVRMAIEIDDIVQITRSRSFSERTQFFAERFFVGIAICPDASFWTVAVRMKDFASYEW